uniref:Uncharacterized protein n=1 Tax=Saccharomyces cerevisiae TaxID=4932 RepID=Q7GIE0_YEASX|nr:unknown protein [Saccharomyces cerevisiae]AAA69853.1 unknown protein [Saccharomyces cerevisiae]AAA69854.1 unknown protein [Saccharomyces cerevisiae]AAA69858.1 unknown protein [Saccharomyces cerevisiae]
MMNKKMSGSQ